MPSKNSLKQYLENGYYHLYNRGVEKRNIFLDKHDYATFLFYLKLYFSAPDSLSDLAQDSPKHIKRSQLNIGKVSLFGKVKLLAYCLMPNHFHLLIHQIPSNGITQLMRQLGTAYSMVFNQRYNHVGPLFQGRYKAVLVETDEQLLHLSRYIHRNPLSLAQVAQDSPKQLETYPYSSLSQYLGHYQTLWLKPQVILSFFQGNSNFSNYASFVREEPNARDNLFVSPFTLE